MGSIRTRGKSWNAQVRLSGWRSFTKSFSRKSDALIWVEETENEIKNLPKSWMLHHSGKNGSSRGTSRRHDVLDTVIKLDRPFNYTQEEGAKFEVHFEKTRGFSGDDAKPIGLSHTMINHTSCWECFSIGTEKAEEVAALLKDGLTQIEIASKLNISQPEVSRRKQQAAAHNIL